MNYINKIKQLTKRNKPNQSYMKTTTVGQAIQLGDLLIKTRFN